MGIPVGLLNFTKKNFKTILVTTILLSYSVLIIMSIFL
jgi:hypothetical protein